MGIRDASGQEKIVIIGNGVVRFAQIIVAAAALGVYGIEKGYWLGNGLPGRIGYDLAVGVIALLTAVILMIVPFVLSYRPVAFAAPWDFIVFILWSAAFGLMRSIFIHDYSGDSTKFQVSNKDQKTFDNHWHSMTRAVWINLAGMILSLISAIMGAVLFWIGRRSGGRGKADYV